MVRLIYLLGSLFLILGLFATTYDFLRYIYTEEFIRLTSLSDLAALISDVKTGSVETPISEPAGPFLIRTARSVPSVVFFIPSALIMFLIASFLGRAVGAVQNRLLKHKGTPDLVARDLPPEDRDKINNEVNQILNQRFLISTAMLTLFAGFSALALQISPNNLRSEEFILGFGSVLTFFIFLLYVQSFFLRRLHRTFGTYLRLTSNSVWETDFDSYRRFGYFAYTKSETVLFAVVQTLASFLPIAVWFLHGRQPIMLAEIAAFMSVGFSLAALEFGMGFFGWFSDDARADKQWRKVLSKPVGHKF